MDERIWSDAPLRPGQTIVCGASTIRLLEVPAAALISGDLNAACAALAGTSTIVGLAELPPRGPYAIRIARDHALLVSDTTSAFGSGWQADGFAVTPADDRFHALAVEGPEARDLLAQGTAVDIETGSPSAALRFAGITVLLTREPGGYVIWVEAAELTYLTSFFRATHGSVGPVTSRHEPQGEPPTAS